MPERVPPRGRANGRILRSRKHRHPAQLAPAPAETGEAPPQVRAPNRIDWPAPMDEEERAALKAGWDFVE